MDLREKLELWKERLERNEAAYSEETVRMDRREELYRGSKTLKPLTALDIEVDGTNKKTPHVRNIIMENIESQISSSIPQPKVRPVRGVCDEAKAKLIEDMIKNELDRLPMEEINDMMERIVPIQGGGLFLVEWDNTERTHLTIGEVCVSCLHPKQVIPQDGVYTGIEDMDYIILKLPQTKGYIKRKYGVDVSDESETEPEIKGSWETSNADDMATQYVAYYRNERGGLGLYSWVNNSVLEDIEDYQARRLKRCSLCGGAEPDYPAETRMEETATDKAPGKTICPCCGSMDWTEGAEDYEEVYRGFTTAGGIHVPGARIEPDERGLPHHVPTRVPFYKPDIYPVILQKNTSVFGRFLGESDVDKVADQQNTVNRMERKIIDLLISAGTMITLPPKAKITVDPRDAKKIYLDGPELLQYIKNVDFTGDITPHLAYLQQTYEEARQILGITDSFQGRRDTTATSGVAKQFAAAQSAGRLESKRVMKDAAYARLFELIFKFKLAYADEPRPVLARDELGNQREEVFNRYDFLEVDEAGEYWWNDQFLFSCDTSAPQANNREQMWESTTVQLQAGCFGDPTATDTLVLFWTKLELLHYPGAAETKRYLVERLEREKAMQQEQLNGQLAMDIIGRAREDARADAEGMYAPSNASLPRKWD